MEAPPAVRMVTADRGDAGRRLDHVLRRHLIDVTHGSRTRVQAWIDDGRVSINGRVVLRAAARTATGDLVGISLPHDVQRAPMVAEQVNISVLYEDDHLLIVNKPAGVVVHPTHRHLTGTMMNALLWYARTWPEAERPSIVGRLDKLTSGLLVVARTARIHAELQRGWTREHTHKDYLALVYGRVNPTCGEIRLALSRDPGDRRKVVASTMVGAPSVTAFERLTTATAPRTGLSLLRCRLVTGRTHQIRVHLAARGWPIVGDPVYGEPRWREIDDPPLAALAQGLARQALHAWRIALTHPVTGRTLQIEAPLPPDLAGLVAAAGFVPNVDLASAKL